MEQAIIELTRAVNRLADAVQSVKEGKEEYSPQTPYKEKGKKPTTTTTTRARARFVKPSVEEVAAYIRAKGYTFDADRFWNYYESKGWKIGNNSMTSWRAACVTWQMRESEASSAAAPHDEGPSEADRFLLECMAKRNAARKEVAE